MSKNITILGAGPAGMAVAYYAKENHLKYEVYEASKWVGGNCITINHNDFLFDSGAHRLHDKDKETTEIIKKLLGDELKLIHVPSQIYRDGFFIDFPLSPLNLFKFLGFRRFFVCSIQILKQKLKWNKIPENFYELAIQAYGKNISTLFLIHYTEKLWGKSAAELSTEVAGKRLKGLNIKTFILEAFSSNKSNKTTHLDGSFYYPKYGIGSIFEKMKQYCGEKNIHLDKRITKIFHQNNKIDKIEYNNHESTVVETLVSSLPLEKMVFLLDPPPPKDIVEKAKKISFRNIILICFFLNKKSINKNGSMYFPSEEFPFTRVYEPKNRSESMAPKNKTSLIVEVPCQKEDKIWKTEESKLRLKIQQKLMDANFFSAEDLIDSKIYRIHNAYPILEKNYRKKIAPIYHYLDQFINLKMTGRNGLFAYTHIHDHMVNGRNIINKI